MASFEIVFPGINDEDGTYEVREMAYCADHSRCTHEPRPTGRWLQPDGTWGELHGTAAEFATLYEAEEALRRVRATQSAPEYVPTVLRRSASGDVEEVPAHVDHEETSAVDPLAEGERDFGHSRVLVLRSRPGGGYDAVLVHRETGRESPVTPGWLDVAYVDAWGDVRNQAVVWVTDDQPLSGTPAWGEWYRAQTPGCRCHCDPPEHCLIHCGPLDGRCSCLGCVPAPVEVSL